MIDRTKKNRYIEFGIYAIFLLLIYLITNLEPIKHWTSAVTVILRPLLIGLVVAYMINPFFRFFERKLFSKINPFSLRRTLSLFFTYLVLFLIFAVLLLLILPQLIDSILSFAGNAENYVDNTVK